MRQRERRGPLRGFTLIELIGVLAVIAILAASILPNVIRQINNAVRDAESKALASMGDALLAGVVEHRYIPGNGTDAYNATGGIGGNGVADWADLIAEQMNESAANILTEENRTCARRYWFDPSNGVGTLLNAAVDANGNGTYQQDVDTIPIVAPLKARAMIIGDLSDGCTNGIATPTTAAQFTATWDQTGAAGSLTESADLYIQRIHYSQYFERITLVSTASSMFGRASYSAEAFTTLPAVPPKIPVILPANVFISSFYANASLVGTTGGTSFAVTIDAVDPLGALALFNLKGPAVAFPVKATIANVQTRTNIQITVAAGVPVAPAIAPTDINGYVDVTVGYGATPYYRVVGTAADVPIALATPVVTMYLLNGSELQLKDQDPVAGTRKTLHTLVAKDADSFTFTPGPPAMWGR